MSLRHLQRAFEGGGSTVAAEISRCRAESAAQLLLAPRTAGLTIADIATRSGYTSAFELRAGFRARYGVLPSQFRGGGMALPATRASGRAESPVPGQYSWDGEFF
ncbi:helix-turn-helix domain-containing protein [Cryobacterium breve]|uniref:Helix-turn-helix domain-containing protein n=1 Tax=Cryobacterium breve TaxID=1259258 RepID=A0ABY7NFC5_9MICO|nr:helix-turn-helix domain-containing protein [Cryobacterium breve]